jgi:hypothetical protein
VLGEPGAAFGRLAALRRQTPSDLLRVARRYFVNEGRSVILVRPSDDPVEDQEAAQ